MTNLLAESPDDTTLAISWERPSTPNGKILSYSVSIINLKHDSAEREENTINTTVTQTGLGISLFLLTAHNYIPFICRTWCSLQCEYCSGEQCRPWRLECFYLLHTRIRYTVKPALVTTCIQRPPLFKDHFVVSQL